VPKNNALEFVAMAGFVTFGLESRQEYWFHFFRSFSAWQQQVFFS